MIVAGSDTVSCTVSDRPLVSCFLFTLPGRSSIETVGGVFATTKLWSRPSTVTKSVFATALKWTVSFCVSPLTVASKAVATLVTSRRASAVVVP